MSTLKLSGGASPVAYIALGSNLGDPLSQLREAKRRLALLGEMVGTSSLYRTTPVGGPAGQPDFLNAVVMLRPHLKQPEQLLAELLHLEAEQGRERRRRWAARTLDLDLLAVDEVIYDDEALSLPHPRMLERAFVLAPLCEIAPDWRHPLSGVSACEALRELDISGVHKTVLEW